jgi:acylphosphatase
MFRTPDKDASMSAYCQIFYAGRVQGVGFRYSVKQLAEGYEVVGWVRYLPDGRVELQAGGTREELDDFLHSIAHGQLARYIKDVAVNEISPFPPGSHGFEIRL